MSLPLTPRTRHWLGSKTEQVPYNPNSDLFWIGICSNCAAWRDRLVTFTSIASSPPMRGGRDPLVVVEHRVDDRLLLLPVGRGQALEIIAADVEEGSVALTLQIEGRDRFLDVDGRETLALDAVILQEPLVRQKRDVPAPFPSLVEIEQAGRFERAAVVPVAGAVGRFQKGAAVALDDAGGADVVDAGFKPMTPLDLAEHALAGEEGRG